MRDEIYFVFMSGSNAYVHPAAAAAAMDRFGSREGRRLMRRSCDTHTNARVRTYK